MNDDTKPVQKRWFSSGLPRNPFLNALPPAVSVYDKNTANNQHLLTKNGHKIEKSVHKPSKRTKKAGCIATAGQRELKTNI